jgi:hypothetical protein
MLKHIRPVTATLALALALGAGAASGCGSNADTVSDNLSKEAEKFNVQRRIVAINGITDRPILDVEGKCSVERTSLGLNLICKYGPDDYRKHFVGISDNVTYTVVQLQGVKVSEYRTKFILRPQSLVPDLDLVTGQSGGRAEQTPTP